MDWRFRSDLPIYAQLVEKIKLGILSGELPPGAKLPPVRELAAQAGVNPNTMQRAMQELEREGLVFPQRTAGRFVTEDVTIIERIKSELAARQIQSFLAAMRQLGYDRGGILALLTEEKEGEPNNADTGM